MHIDPPRQRRDGDHEWHTRPERVSRVNQLLPRRHPAVNARVTMPDRDVPAQILAATCHRLTPQQCHAPIAMPEEPWRRHQRAVLRSPHVIVALWRWPFLPAARELHRRGLLRISARPDPRAVPGALPRVEFLIAPAVSASASSPTKPPIRLTVRQRISMVFPRSRKRT